MAGEAYQRHPQDTMDDITEISSGREIERVNTLMITKSMEVSAKTLASLVVGAVIGGVMFLLLYSLIGMTASSIIFAACTALCPFLMVGTVRDATQERRWRRALHALQSRNIEGEVFYVNSLKPENIVDLQEIIIR